MKKLSCILLALICVLTAATACGETDFALRNGVRFGDTRSAVWEKESWAPIEGIHIFQFSGEMLGIPSMVTYRFLNENGEDEMGQGAGWLKTVSYCVNTVYDENGKTVYSDKSCFNYVCSSLMIKYGSPLADPASIDSYRMNPLVRYYIQWLSGMNMRGCTDFDRLSVNAKQSVWVIPEKNANVVIELFEYEVLQDGKNCYLTLLNYSSFTDDEFQKLQSYVSENVGDL